MPCCLYPEQIMPAAHEKTPRYDDGFCFPTQATGSPLFRSMAFSFTYCAGHQESDLEIYEEVVRCNVLRLRFLRGLKGFFPPSG